MKQTFVEKFHSQPCTRSLHCPHRYTKQNNRLKLHLSTSELDFSPPTWRGVARVTSGDILRTSSSSSVWLGPGSRFGDAKSHESRWLMYPLPVPVPRRAKSHDDSNSCTVRERRAAVRDHRPLPVPTTAKSQES
jgi:hypothetical protein